MAQATAPILDSTIASIDGTTPSRSQRGTGGHSTAPALSSLISQREIFFGATGLGTRGPHAVEGDLSGSSASRAQTLIGRTA